MRQAALLRFCVLRNSRLHERVLGKPIFKKMGRGLEDGLAQPDKYLSTSVRCPGGQVAGLGGLGQEGQTWETASTWTNRQLHESKNIDSGNTSDKRILLWDQPTVTRIKEYGNTSDK